MLSCSSPAVVERRLLVLTIVSLLLFACTFTGRPGGGGAVVDAAFHCPSSEGDCVVECTSQTEIECDVDEILVADNSVCGCCTKCVGGIALDEACSDKENSTACAVGLKCLSGACVYDKESCFFTKHIEDTTDIILPRCEIDGSYASAQCKGDRSSGRCFCYSKTGQRIFGWDWWRNVDDPDAMTCACSRRRHELETVDRRFNVTLHCQANGDFEPLQCDSGLCWCAEEKTGRLRVDTVTVPQDLFTMLPCYNSTIYGDQYLRQCDSVSFAQSLLRTTLAERGSTNVRFVGIQCHYDGTYGTYKVEGNNAYCMWRDGTNLSPYQDASNSVSNMNCHCARDLKIFAAEGFQMPLSCSSNGNYALLQDLDGETFCVDQDGFVASPTFTTAIHQDDCKKYVYYLL